MLKSDGAAELNDCATREPHVANMSFFMIFRLGHEVIGNYGYRKFSNLLTDAIDKLYAASMIRTFSPAALCRSKVERDFTGLENHDL